MKLYLERCYGPFKAVAAEVPLQSLITLSILARTESTLEIKALIVANFLEVVRFQYAANVLVPANRAVRHRDDFLDPTVFRRDSIKAFFPAGGMEQCRGNRQRR